MDPISVCEVIAPTGARDRQRESIRRFQRLEEAASDTYEAGNRIYAGSGFTGTVYGGGRAPAAQAACR